MAEMDELVRYLGQEEGTFDPEAGLQASTWHGPGYHSRVPPGTRVHGTRPNLDYAVLLLRSPHARHHERAARIVEKVLALQETDPGKATYGIWPWLFEEPLERMAPPDWNWADFCGAALATMLVETPGRLEPPLREAMRAALQWACEAIVRRNVGPGYTNIAIMGACVTAAAGEILDDAAFLDYGRDRLARFAAHTRFHGGLNEYNSPTYTFVALHELERTLQLVRDAALREIAEGLRQDVWRWLGERFHPATGQLAGPHSRAYADLLPPGTARELADGTGVAIAGAAAERLPSVVRHLPCPPSLGARFEVLPGSPSSVRSRFIREDPDSRSTYGTTWFCGDACLGSINMDCTWVQRRPVLAYVRTADATAVLKVRFLRDGHDCASAGIRTAQDGGRLLSVLQLLTDRGDHHIHLDRPSDGVFRARELALRWELSGPGVTLAREGCGAVVFQAGAWTVRLRLGKVVCDGREGMVEVGSAGDVCWADAVLVRTEEVRGIRFAGLGPTGVAAALEVSGPGAAAGPFPELTVAGWPGDLLQAGWGGLEAAVPSRPGSFVQVRDAGARG
ncbi:MAG: hypothetical protein JXR77_01520 [Lentisphaeria bacterium]|nr:hypothetical protein [Lentisphaeria bacterium]